MEMVRHIRLTAFLGLLVAGASTASAQGVAFDIGLPESTYVYCSTDGVSWELYPPYPFGNYPPGSIVWASLEQLDCSQLAEVGGVCLGAFVASFDGGGCGCNGVLVEPTELELHYDAAALAAARVDEESLRLLIYGRMGPGWAEVPGSTVDPDAHAMRGQEAGGIVGQRWYAIVGDPPTSAAPTTWSGVKSLWR
ncbi:MAG: hypothetical protein ACE5G2_00790 [Candidatus Krumholzibacteriia bacterium]